MGYGGYPLVIILVMKHGYKYEAFGFWENPKERNGLNCCDVRELIQKDGDSFASLG